MRRPGTMFRKTLLVAMTVQAAGCIEDQSVRANQPPVANAGKDQQLDYEDEPVDVRLDGRKSSDLDGEVVEYLWRSADSGPDGGAPDDKLDPDDEVRPELRLDRGSYVFTLWVRDDEETVSAPDSVTVRVGTDPVAECVGSLPMEVPAACGKCLCGVSDDCRAAVAGCDTACWELITCIGASCPDATDFTCITTECAAFLGGGAAAMAFGNAMCFTPCAEACATPSEADAGS